ncbi:MAG TPA: outer membrane protein assembly factor BamD [Acetobacteraceae bacterium]|nr:outer membrane protein assembly factor BamD [Acetobacteraceae bacterium]
MKQIRPQTRKLGRRLAPFSLALPLLLGGCGIFGGKPDTESAKPAEVSQNLPPAGTLYTNGLAYLRKDENKKAADTFNEIEVNYPYSTWATHAELLHGFAEYRRQDFVAAIGSINRFIELHPASPDIAYAYYLRSLCYYEQIEGVQRDQTATLQAAQALQDVVTRFPDSAYARDARIKLRLVQNRLAGHDMSIGRFYERQHLYGAAIGRYQSVIEDYQTTTYAPEALERLVECYLDLGLVSEARRSAAVLGYNYPGSRWYRLAYDKLRAHDLLSGRAPRKKSGGFLFGLL